MKVTPAANFRNLAEKYFGQGTIKLDRDSSEKNNITGALACFDNFGTFSNNLQKRFERLALAYKDHAERKHLLDTVANLGRKKNWAGAYAELVTYDYLNSDQGWLAAPVGLSKDSPASETLADALGMTEVNHDGYYPDINLLFDVKVLGDKIDEMLSNVVAGAKKRAGDAGVAIEPEYPIDMDFSPYESKVGLLVSELHAALDDRNITFLKSSIIPELSYRLLRGQGVLTTTSCYDPYLHAKNHHKLLFQHAKKFSVTNPSVIVFVIFPWFSESSLGSGWGNEAFYRAFARRFFFQYLGNEESAAELIKKSGVTVTKDEVTRNLSGVLFIEDHSITNGIKGGVNSTQGVAYLNPNARHKVCRTYRRHLENLQVTIDDFEHDNY